MCVRYKQTTKQSKHKMMSQQQANAHSMAVRNRRIAEYGIRDDDIAALDINRRGLIDEDTIGNIRLEVIADNIVDHPIMHANARTIVNLTDARDRVSRALAYTNGIEEWVEPIIPTEINNQSAPRQGVIYVRNPITGRQIVKHGALYKRLQREGRIPEDPQTDRQRRRQEQRQQQPARPRQATMEEREAAKAQSILEQQPTESVTEPCAICMSETQINPIKLQECGHIYCIECIEQWVRASAWRSTKQCPTCRTDITRNKALH